MAITEEDYLNIGKQKLEGEIDKWVELVREKKVSMGEVPRYLLLEVRARI